MVLVWDTFYQAEVEEESESESLKFVDFTVVDVGMFTKIDDIHVSRIGPEQFKKLKVKTVFVFKFQSAANDHRAAFYLLVEFHI